MVAAIRTDVLDSIKADIPMRRLAKPEEMLMMRASRCSHMTSNSGWVTL
ncbi:hypothetical protein [Acinetobacter towneri]